MDKTSKVRGLLTNTMVTDSKILIFKYVATGLLKYPRNKTHKHTIFEHPDELSKNTNNFELLKLWIAVKFLYYTLVN